MIPFILLWTSLFASETTYDDLLERRLIDTNEHPKLHLGCGERHKDGYINIDFPMQNRPLQSKETADYYSDVLKLCFPEGMISAIENHHMFEHFSRPVSIALLCAWHFWLENGGELVIETPDFAKGIKRYLKENSFSKRQVIIRHLFGSQEASWALHYDGWSEDKFRYILSKLGFQVISATHSSWLCTDNIEVKAQKQSQLQIDQLKEIGREFLKFSMVDQTPSEVRMWEGWCVDFEKALDQMVSKPMTLSNLIPKNAVIFDVGAHLGAKTESYLNFSPKLVVAIEPQPICIQELRRKFSQNSHVQIIPYCLNEYPGSIEISICTDAPTISTCANHWKQGRFSNYTWDKKETVEATTLDHLISLYGTPDYCKIDVEGFEYSVIKGLSSAVPLLSIEYTREFFEETKKILFYLKDLGMNEFNFTIGESPSFYLSTFTDIDMLIQTISSIHDDFLWGDIYIKKSEQL